MLTETENTVCEILDYYGKQRAVLILALTNFFSDCDLTHIIKETKALHTISIH